MNKFVVKIRSTRSLSSYASAGLPYSDWLFALAGLYGATPVTQSRVCYS
jgi:hypothetical protein